MLKREREKEQQRLGDRPGNSSVLLTLRKLEFKYLPDVWRVHHFVNSSLRAIRIVRGAFSRLSRLSASRSHRLQWALFVSQRRARV